MSNSGRVWPHLISVLGVALFKLAAKCGPLTSQGSPHIRSLFCPSTESCPLPNVMDRPCSTRTCPLNIKIPSVFAQIAACLICSRKLTGSNFRITRLYSVRPKITVECLAFLLRIRKILFRISAQRLTLLRFIVAFLGSCRKILG